MKQTICTDIKILDQPMNSLKTKPKNDPMSKDLYEVSVPVRDLMHKTSVQNSSDEIHIGGDFQYLIL